MAAEREFATRRRNALHELYDLDGDRSRKGSVDAPIQVRRTAGQGSTAWGSCRGVLRQAAMGG